MNKQEIINRLAANKPACWLFWEVQNIKRTFGDEIHEFTIKIEQSSQKHTLYDSIENMIASILSLIGYEEKEALEVWDIFEDLELTLINEHVEHKFIIT